MALRCAPLGALLSIALLLVSGLCCLTGTNIEIDLGPSPPRATATPTFVFPTPAPPSDSGSSPALLNEARLNAAVMPVHDPIALRGLLAPGTLFPSTPTPSSYRVGDHRTFRLNGANVDAELIHITDHTYTWLVTSAQADRQALIAAAERFERDIYTADHQYFGSEWSPGIDGDVHLSMLHYSDPDEDAAGSFDPSDELPRWINATSNETEMFYVNLDSMDPGDDFYFAVLAHEFEHMIHWNTDRNEANWLDEGLAELACRAAGFDPGDNDEAFFAQPDTQLTDWPYSGDNTVHYGAGYVFALYLWERFGDGLIWDLVHHPADGMASLDAVLAAHNTGVTADQVFADWVAANAIELRQMGDFAIYQHEDWKAVMHMDASHNQYPVTRQATVLPYATDYVELTGQGELLLRFQGTPEASLWPVKPHTGQTVWWSNQGDRSDARLSRRFDLSGLTRATLRYWTWYDLESGYDYVYVSASGDEGQTWTVLSGQHNTGRGDYGPGYNGQSGEWVEEQIDLSRYAGRPVWLRFDYVTDDSINGAGFLLDDLSIPELGLYDSCDEEGEWQAEGFVLLGETVPQRWLVQAITFPAGGGEPQVERMTMDERQYGEMALTLGAGVERVVLAISVMVRGVTSPASYHYEITPQ